MVQKGCNLGITQSNWWCGLLHVGTEVERCTKPTLEGPVGLRDDAWLLLSRIESQGHLPRISLDVCSQQKWCQGLSNT